MYRVSKKASPISNWKAKCHVANQLKSNGKTTEKKNAMLQANWKATEKKQKTNWKPTEKQMKKMPCRKTTEKQLTVQKQKRNWNTIEKQL